MTGPLFVYLYKKNASDGEELRYSLRSLQANFFVRNGLPRVVIVGDKPSWFVEGDHIEVEQNYDKYRNILKNVLVACHRLQDEKQFFYMDDDYFLLDPTDHVLLTHRGSLAAHFEKILAFHGPGHEYSKHMLATVDYAKKYGYDPDARRSFELHRPMPVRPELASVVLTSMWSTIDPIPFWRTVYGNAVEDMNYDVARLAADGRLGSVPTPGVPWLSTADAQWRGKYGKMIRAMFPNPSIWES